MNSLSKVLLSAAVSLPLLVSAHDDEELNDPNVQLSLRAMRDTSTWFHPDLFGEFAGMRHYAHRQYQAALKYFESGAYYADKLSQLSIGLMHMNGEGTQKDPIAALAWFNIASERGYPNFVATREKLKATLTPEQIARADEMSKTLALRYGDAVAKKRLIVQLRQGLMQMTGSHTGFNFGITTVVKNTPQVAIGGSTDIYAKNRWDPDLYFKARDAEWKATVTVGPIEVPSRDEKPKESASQTQPGSIPH